MCNVKNEDDDDMITFAEALKNIEKEKEEIRRFLSPDVNHLHGAICVTIGGKPFYLLDPETYEKMAKAGAVLARIESEIAR